MKLEKSCATDKLNLNKVVKERECRHQLMEGLGGQLRGDLLPKYDNGVSVTV